MSSSWAARFAPPPGSWECAACLVNNPPTAKFKCVSCETDKPGAKAAAAAGGAPAFKAPVFGITPGGGRAAAAVGAQQGGGAAAAAFKAPVFGLPQASAPPLKMPAFGIPPSSAAAPAAKVTFGIAPAAAVAASPKFTFGVGPAAAAAAAASAAAAAAAAPTPVPMRTGFAPFERGTSVAAGALVTGSGECGQLGLGEDEFEVEVYTPLDALADKGIVRVVAGAMHTLALDSTGGVWCWGCNDDGALGRRTGKDKETSEMLGDETVPERLDDLPPIALMACGASHSIVVTAGGEAYSWGSYREAEGPLGFMGLRRHVRRTPSLLLNPKTQRPYISERITQVACGAHHTLAVSASGKLWAWGDSEFAQLGRKLSRRHKLEGLVPTLVQFGGKRKRGGKKSMAVKSIGAGSYHSLAVDEGGRVYAWGLNNYGQCGVGMTSETVQSPAPIAELEGVGVAEVTGGEHHSICMLNDGTLRSWGRGDYGQLGLGQFDQTAAGDKYHELVPKALDAVDRAISVSSGDNHCTMLRSDGRLFTWGFNVSEQLGFGDGEDIHDTPTALTTGALESATVIDSTAGGQHSVALTAK